MDSTQDGVSDVLDGTVKRVVLDIIVEDEPSACLNWIVALPFEQSIGGLLVISIA